MTSGQTMLDDRGELLHRRLDTTVRRKMTMASEIRDPVPQRSNQDHRQDEVTEYQRRVGTTIRPDGDPSAALNVTP